MATGLNNLAALYTDQRRYTKAEPLYQRALAITKKALGPEHPEWRKSRQPGVALHAPKAVYAKAEPLYQRRSRS